MKIKIYCSYNQQTKNKQRNEKEDQHNKKICRRGVDRSSAVPAADDADVADEARVRVPLFPVRADAAFAGAVPAGLPPSVFFFILQRYIKVLIIPPRVPFPDM